MRELEEEKRQRRSFEKASLILLFLSLVLLAVVAGGALRYGSVASQRDSEQARAQSNGTAARGLASRVKQACASGGVESARLHRSGLCVDAVRVERSVQGVPGPAGVRGPQGPAGVDGSAGPQGSPGLNGVKGPDGLPGANGSDGKDGKDGRSVVSVYCSGGRLVVKYSDGVASTISGSVACESVTPSPVVTVSSRK
ncbi:collagen like minor tail [Propionibacterium phage P104A]|uniref:Minor tail protein n=1 Tax=Propionibacterium phage P104A TaxID=1229787 RepID=K4HNT9_9CAUD|nr:collagen like minor tail [Propionibacterium phage P104A]AFT97614.1 minor tail protein [Propionibacterium phage P104A]